MDPSLLSPDQPWWSLLFALFIGHAVADYPLQGEFLARGKNHRLPPDLVPEGLREIKGLWFHCPSAHSVIHAGAVWLITGVLWLGLVEFVLHWVIDFMKSERWTNFHVDQFLHLLCKAGYVAVIHLGWAGIVPG